MPRELHSPTELLLNFEARHIPKLFLHCQDLTIII